MLKKIKIMFVLALMALVLPLSMYGCSGDGKVDYWDGSMYFMRYSENFKIMQLADIQATNTENCDIAFIEINKLVEKEKPNLIVLSGDNVESPKSEDVLDRLIFNMENLNIPWAPVFGNHDAEGVLTKDFMAEKFIEAPNCIFHKGEEGVDGVGNYVINLKSGEGITYSIFMIDSQMYHVNGGYDSIHTNQIEWYESSVEKIKEMNGNKTVPSLAYFHIPLHEFADAKESFEKGESEGFANFNEGVYPGKENTGFFSKAKELESTKAIFCAHDHVNNCDIEYQGIHLVYGLKSSRLSYYNNDLLGATITNISKNGITISNSYFKDVQD